MQEVVPQLGLIAALVLLNGLFAGSEIALISLRDGQLSRLAARNETGRKLARLARDPNRFLATIQVGITLAGFLASAVAAVSLAEPLVGPLGFLGGSAEAMAILLVTLLLTFLTLVLGELVPKRMAMQRPERWGMLAARPLSGLARVARPVVWLLGVSTDLIVRILGGDPGRHRVEVTEQELADLVASQTSFSREQRRIISGAFEIGDRLIRQVLVPRSRVFSLGADDLGREAAARLIEDGHSRAPVIRGDLDDVVGVVSLRDLVTHPDQTLETVARPAVFLPESLLVIDALLRLQHEREQLALVVDEHGGVEGIVSVEDLVEELVGEIYDEADPDVRAVERLPDGSLLLNGNFPVHDLGDIDVYLPEGDYTTVAGLYVDRLGRIPKHPGDQVEVEGWILESTEVRRRAVRRLRLRRADQG
jgi:putative hemolysin